VVASDSVTGYRRRLEDQERPLWFVRDQATADDLATHYVHRKMHPPRHVRLDTGLHGLTAELGSTISLTHADGPGDSAAGWVTRQLMVEAVEVDLGEGRVSLLCWDYEVMPGYPPSVTYEAGEVPAGVAFSLGAGQGVSSGTQTVTIIQGMTRIYLGGSETERTVIATANVWVRGRGSVDPILPSSQLPATWQCDIEIMAPPGVSVTPRIVAGSGDWSNKSVQGTGVASSATDWTWQPITVQRREGTWAYRVELTANSNDTRAGFKGAQFEL
jgi:hypothetical protein